MNPTLHTDQVFNMQITTSDAALLYRALGFAESETNIANVISGKSYQRLRALKHQLENRATTLVTYTE
jgi:hypothetical protein|tara:strand:+ start:424 stop:627 length:204 start_codon:yes stop_codon:yes gene_type:complete